MISGSEPITRTIAFDIGLSSPLNTTIPLIRMAFESFSVGVLQELRTANPMINRKVATKYLFMMDTLSYVC